MATAKIYMVHSRAVLWAHCTSAYTPSQSGMQDKWGVRVERVKSLLQG